MQRVLVIRGGAIGDFILTLPALGALRQALPHAYIDVLSNPHRAIFAQHAAYANHIREPDTLALHRLFSPRATMPAPLAAYLGAFDLIVAYVPRVDEPFAAHLHRSCPGHVVLHTLQSPAGVHMTDHLLQPVQDLWPHTYDPVPHVYLTDEACAAAARFWQTTGLPETGVVALHPGSGGVHKVWDMVGWRQVLHWAADQHLPCVIVCGPAEHEKVRQLMHSLNGPAWPCLREMPLLHVAAILARCRLFVGHDSGMTHLAAAVGTTTLALFGPTDPWTWAPRSMHACVLQPHSAGALTVDTLPPGVVIQTLETLWRDTFAFAPSRIGCTVRQVAG
jgi:heptosyltransferase-2